MSLPAARQPRPGERPADREPGADHRAISMPATGNPRAPRSFTETGIRSPRYSRNRVRQALAYRRTDGAVVKLGEQIRLSVKIGDPIWARVNEETLCTPDAINLDDLAELERQGVSFARVLAPARQAAS